MLSALRSKLSYANLIATLALFVALGGSSYAAAHLITGKDVKNSSLTGKDLKNNSVTGKDVKGIRSGDVADGSLLGKDFRAGELPAGPKGDTGPAGPAGPAGATAGAADGDYPDPPPNPTAVLEKATIDMPTSGRIYVQGSVRSATGSCTFTSTAPGTSGNCTMTVGLYVDGQPVPNTARSFGNSSASGGTSFSTNISGSDYDWGLFGVSAVVPAGSHQVQLSGTVVAQPNNATTTGSIGPNAPNAQAIVGGIALGG